MISQRFCSIVFTTLLLLFLLSCDSTEPDLDPDIGIFPAENIAGALDYALNMSSQTALGNYALLIWQSGELLVEEYRGNDFNGSVPHPIYSGTKSLAGIMAALAVRDGLFSFDTTLGELIESWDPESERGRVTIRQLLNLTSGIETAPIGAFLDQSGSILHGTTPPTMKQGTTPWIWMVHLISKKKMRIPLHNFYPLMERFSSGR